MGRRGTGLDAHVAFGLACCATLVVSPLSWGHYFMVELPALICVPIWFWRRGMPMVARIAAGVPVVLSWSYYVAMPYVGGLGVLGLGTAAWFLGVCGLVLCAEVSGGFTRTSASIAEPGLSGISGPPSVLSSQHPIVRARDGRRRREWPASPVRWG